MRSTSATISRRWKGLDRTLACLGALEEGCSATAAKPVMNMILSAGVHLGGALGQFDPVHAGHDDVGQQQIEAEALEAFEGLGPVAEIGHGVAGLHQRLGQEPAQRFVVFCQ